MMESGFNLIVTIYLSIVFHRGHGSVVIQPHSRAVNPDGVVSISCEYTADAKSVEDVRLNRISPTDRKRTLLCQKGNNDCHLRNILMSQKNHKNPKEWLFILYKVEPQHVNVTYECEFTVNDKNDLHVTSRGSPTRLLRGQKETENCSPPASPPPSPQSDPLSWILIALLTLLFLCICVIVCFFIRLRKSKEERENGTYVEMRKAPLTRNPPVGVYCGN